MLEKESKLCHESGLKLWHAATREKLLRMGRNDKYDDKWGRFLPNQRFNVDQSPLPFVMQMNRTYEHFDEDQRTTKVWIAQPGAGLEKRQCTLQICLRAGEPPQMGKTIFFLILSKWLNQHSLPIIDISYIKNSIQSQEMRWIYLYRRGGEGL